MTWPEIIGLIISSIGTIAACIAAYPIIKSWMPLKISSNEKDILKLAIKNPKFNGIIEYNLEPMPYVKSPYRHNETIDVTIELLELRDKDLIQVMDSSFGKPERTEWYQLTAKGYSIAKRLF